MSSSRIAEIRLLIQNHGISYSTAYRWLKTGDVESCVRIHLERQQLRDDCARNGTPMHVAHNRRWCGVPLEQCGAPLRGRNA